MVDEMDQGWIDLGERVALARTAVELSQADLAARVGIDRTALTKIESGSRRVNALELARIAATLGRSFTWFVSATPTPILSRRAGPGQDQALADLRAELLLEDLVLDVETLAALDVLERPAIDVRDFALGEIVDESDAERAAEVARDALGNPRGALSGLADVLGQFGLLVYTDDLGDGCDGLMARSESGAGVCLVNSSSDPGRRRATAAHELGHFIFDDAYSAEHLASTGPSRRESLIDAFAGAFLLPGSSLRDEWHARGGPDEPRTAAVSIAARYRASWSAVRVRLVRAGLVARNHELGPAPVLAEFIACGVLPEPDLVGRSVPPAVGQAIMRAYTKDSISGERALEMLRGVVDVMPPQSVLPMRAFKGDFYPAS